MGKQRNVLFLCTGNSARSILAESILNAHGGKDFRGYSAGSFPKGAVRPEAIRLLTTLGLPTDGLRSKSWEEFARPGAPEMDFVFTVCDQAAGEVCPIWPGQPVTAHWGILDPAPSMARRRSLRRPSTKYSGCSSAGSQCSWRFRSPHSTASL